MSSLIKIYKDNPTAGGVDGTLISSGTDLAPVESGAIKVPVADFQEGLWVKLALRCDAGYETVEDVEATPKHATLEIVDSTSVTLWRLAPDSAGSAGTPEAWGDPMNITAQIDATNTIFWARARTGHTEIPVKDRTVDFKVTAYVGAE